MTLYIWRPYWLILQFAEGHVTWSEYSQQSESTPSLLGAAGFTSEKDFLTHKLYFKEGKVHIKQHEQFGVSPQCAH